MTGGAVLAMSGPAILAMVVVVVLGLVVLLTAWNMVMNRLDRRRDERQREAMRSDWRGLP